MIKITEKFTAAGSPQKPNEDMIYYSEHCAAVLDGATNLNGSEYGADEFVRDFLARFDINIRDLSLYKAINQSIKELYSKKFGANKNVTDIQLYSSAAAAFAHEHDGILDVVTVGDCTALVFTDDGIEKIYDSNLDALDGAVINRLIEMRKLSNPPKDISELVKSPEIVSMLIKNRKAMNTPNGYRSLSFDMIPLTKNEIMSFDVKKIKKVVLFSDGYKSVEQEITDGLPIADIYKSLRAEENADLNLNSRPRFKVSDDASLISFTID